MKTQREYVPPPLPKTKEDFAFERAKKILQIEKARNRGIITRVECDQLIDALTAPDPQPKQPVIDWQI